MCFYKMGQFIGCRNRLTHDLVRRVQKDEPEAILELLDIFDEKIRQYAAVELYDRNGNPVRVFSRDYAAQLEDRLVQAFREIGLPGIGKNHRRENKKQKKNRKAKPARNCCHKRTCRLGTRLS